MRIVLCTLACLVAYGDVAAADLPRPYKPKGGYKVVVSGTGTLELNLASAPWACGSQAENLILLKGVYRSNLAPKSTTIHRAPSWTRKKPYGPHGIVAPFTVSGTSEETYNDYAACPPIIGTGGPATKSCTGSTTKTLSSSTHQLQLYRDGKGVRVSLQTNKGDRRTDGFPGPANSCALGISEQHPIEISEKVPTSKFTGRKGSLVLSKTAPVSFQRTFPNPFTPYAPLNYTGSATYQLKVDWQRTRKGPASKKKKKSGSDQGTGRR